MRNFFNSSFLQQATYDAAAQIMLLTMRDNRTYSYNDVDIDLWNGLIRAESAGLYFNDNFRDNPNLSYQRVI